MPIDDHSPFQEELKQVFIHSAWEDNPENRRRIDALRTQLESQLTAHPQLLDAFEAASADGEQARRLAAELTRRLNRDGDSEPIRRWLADIKAGLPPRIGTHLDIVRNKALKRRTSQQRRWTVDADVRCSGVEAVRLARGAPHPNSLRHQKPSHHWHVLIDETGSRFDDQTDDLGMNDFRLGRLVALAIPAGSRLPQIGRFHGTDATVAEADTAVAALLRHPVGIFGFTVNDPAIQAASWLSHVIWLVRWTLVQLPVTSGASTTVDVLIEQRADYRPDHDLRALTEMLYSDLRQMSPQRYADLYLNMRFMDKDQARNGYVDAIAFTWGSPTAASRDRLKKTGWLGHCLLRPCDRALERLYLALHAGRELPPAQWYELCAAAEPEGGLLDEALTELGISLPSRPGYWNACLNEVRQRMQAKRFQLQELARALAWLERWAAPDSALPPVQQLVLDSARLAVDNHLGQVDEARALRCLDLIRTLHDEAPEQACEAILRIAVASTNLFEFELMRPTLIDWLDKPIAVPGLLNHAKLHSTLGQIDAFTGNTVSALEHFDRALAAFARLSDPEQAKREILQTRAYRLLARMQTPDHGADALFTELQTYFRTRIGKSKPVDISRSIAHSGQDLRYAQHLWLRALVSQPGAFADARAAYLQQAHAWQAGDDHPWPLIETYRAWLLHDAGDRTKAGQHLSWAIDECADTDKGPVLHWMAAVLRTLAKALGITVHFTAPIMSADTLRQTLPAAPHAALAEFARHASSGQCTHEDILHALRQCLPFSFH